MRAALRMSLTSLVKADQSGMNLPDLGSFRFSSLEAQTLREQFGLIATNLELHAVPSELRKSVPSNSGCYFWTMRLGGAEFKIYIGRTRSMRKRLADYANDIQIHAPNDYKLRFFQEFIHEADKSATFDLYFTAVGEDRFKAREVELVNKFRPFINFLRHNLQRIVAAAPPHFV